MGQPDPSEIAEWREVERQRLQALRLALSPQERQAASAAVAAELDRLVEPRAGVTIGAYWPFRGELDLRDWMQRACERGARVALPVVERKDHPMVFRQWMPGAPMIKGALGIPIPAGEAVLTPDVVIAPLLGFDAACYRLGYGGGYFDRTLAALSPRPRLIGVAHSSAGVPTIYPLDHDVPMDVCVTEAGCNTPAVQLA